ncbi:MAG: XdhC family protein, partial [Bacteroidota bacterium]
MARTIHGVYTLILRNFDGKSVLIEEKVYFAFMREYLDTINGWIESNLSFAMARVIKTWGSSPRPMGSIMFINQHGEMVGSVSGGCVEGAVVKAAIEVLKDGKSKKLAYGISDEDAWSVGLSCGGSIQVFLQRFMAFDNRSEQRKVWEVLNQNISANTSSILVSSIEDGVSSNTLLTVEGELYGDSLNDEVLEAANEAFGQRVHGTFESGGKDYFIQVFPKKSQLLIIGAAHITVDLVELGSMYGFETIVIDPRGFFAQNTSFKTHPDKIIEAYPSEVLGNYSLDPYTYAIILSHDPKIDDNALEVLLPSKVAYIGALGSRKTHAKRTARLLEKGRTQEEIDRIKAPIGSITIVSKPYMLPNST